jgi:pyridoxamine 5'-phosphate oxidase
MERKLQLADDPFVTLQAWYDEALAAGTPFADAIALATATPDGRPSVRMVLYKGNSGGGIRFFTNYESRKALELARNPRVAIVFFWALLHAQVRVEGQVERLPDEESDDYFRTRPRESQLGAWASPQSREVPDRDTLDRSFKQVAAQHAGHDVPRPPHWGGYRILPESFEFWIGQDHRMHDRFLYRWH